MVLDNFKHIIVISIFLWNHYCSCYHEQTLKQKKTTKRFKKFGNLDVNAEVAVLKRPARDHPRQNSKVNGRQESRRAGRTKPITKPALKKSRIHSSSAAPIFNLLSI